VCSCETDYGFYGAQHGERGPDGRCKETRKEKSTQVPGREKKVILGHLWARVG